MMANYFGELMVVVISVIVAVIGINFVAKTVFNELTKYRKTQTEPYEDALNGLLNTCGEAFEKMVNVMSKEMDDTKTTEYYDFKENVKD